MPIGYVGTRGAGAAGQGGGSIALNSGLTGGSRSAVQAGDLVVIVVCVGTAARTPSIAIATPTGYTPLTVQRVTTTAYDVNLQVSYKVMGSTPDTAVTIPASGNNADGIAYLVYVFSGVDPTTPMDVTATYATGTATTNANPAAITPVTAGAWILVAGGGAAATGTQYTTSYLTNFASLLGQDTNDAVVGVGYFTGWTSGSYDPAAFTGGSATANDSWAATTMALRPFVAVTHDTTGALTGQGSTLAGAATRFRAYATSGALTGQGSEIVGSADRQDAPVPVTHDTSGVLAGQGSTVSGVSARFRAFATTGTLVGQSSSIVGAASNFTPHAASGTLTGQGSTVAGSAARTRVHPSSGVLAGQVSTVSGSAAVARLHATSGVLAGSGAVVAGSAARVGAPVAHATDGILVGSGSSVSGSASRNRAFQTTGSLIGQPSQISGAASRTRLHTASGVLSASGSAVAGSAARVAALVTHATSGALLGAGAVLSGSANRDGLAPPSVGDYTHLRRRRRI